MWDLTDALLLPSTVAPRQCRDSGWSQSQSQVIVGGTLIRRSTRVRVRVSSFVLSWRTERESNRSTHNSGSNGLPL